jgi:sarcosine oxidase
VSERLRSHYEYIVLGCGALGSGAAYWLARRAGGEVLALEQFKLGHPHGSSQDHSRIIRLTYEQEAYTRLAPHAYAAWATLEEESLVRVVTRTGGIQMTPADPGHRRPLRQYAEAMDAESIPYEWCDAAEIMRRWPQFRLKQPVIGLYQSETGIADPNKGNAAHIALAQRYGATIVPECPVLALRPFEGGVEVVAERGRFTCRRLIVTAGAWTDKVLASVGVNLGLTITQEQVTYYATPNLKDFAIGRFPVFMWDGTAWIYGFPVYGEVATKIAIDAAGPVVTADTRTYEPDPHRERLVEDWLREYLPGFLGPKLYTKTCLYDMPRDRNFVVDSLPEHPQIIVCVGAGHAFKFASLLGKILSQLALDGQTEYPIEAFSITRPAITDPAYPLDFGVDWLPDKGA